MKFSVEENMNRRSFLQKSSLILPGLGVSTLLGIPGKLRAAQVNQESFSLSVVTDQPDKAISMIQVLLNRKYPGYKNINYSEYVLHGTHVADIVYIQDGQLIDFYRNNSPVNSVLGSIASDLSLPRSCENPVLCHFSISDGMQKPRGFRVFKDDALILEKAFPGKTETIILDGKKGRLVLEAAADHSVSFVETSCTHKTCMTMGKISQPGQNLVCVPNGISVTIAGQPVSGVDSITF